MNRPVIQQSSKVQAAIDNIFLDFERRVATNPTGMCPIDACASFLRLCHAQSCGKCTPCRIGIGTVIDLLEDILDGNGSDATLALIEKTARVIHESADCAIGYEAAEMILKAIDGFKEDFYSHINSNSCMCDTAPVPCMTLCPAHVDIPGYIALIADGRSADAIKLIRRDNPFPTACALICEHPCEAKCRRQIIDDAINIRGLKRYAADTAGSVPTPPCHPDTGKKVAIVGGGPAGLTAAYYLRLMGHAVTVFEEKAELGGMLYYGIPNYRLPKNRLKEDIDAIISTGVDVHLNYKIGGENSMEKLRREYDATFIAIGAHTDKKLRIEGEDAHGVIPAVSMLRDIASGNKPDFTGKNVVVVGGGNVAMDATRSAVRCGALTTTIVYRRRKSDMTALPEEIEGAIAEGAEIMELFAPSHIEKDGDGNVTALVVDPKIISTYDRAGRPTPIDSGKQSISIPCDIVIVAIGQDIVSEPFAAEGIPTSRNLIVADDKTAVAGVDGVFSGGDCVSGPSTVIKAVAAGKAAAAAIDEYLGFAHTISVEVDIPAPNYNDKVQCGRVQTGERGAEERSHDFELIEINMSEKEAKQEACRCLGCDHFGCGAFKGGRVKEW